MKVVCIFLMLLVVTSARNTEQEKQIKATGPPCPLPDPLFAPRGPLNVNLPPILHINEGGTHENLTVTGLSTLFYEYNINILFLTIDFHVTLGEVLIETNSFDNVNGNIDLTPLRPETVPSGNFRGRGSASISVNNLDLKGKATLSVNLIGNKVSIKVLNVDNLSFDSVSIDFGPELLINEESVDWKAWSSTFKQNFDQDWKTMKSQVVEKVRLTLNTVIGEYTLKELLELLDGDDCDENY